MAGRVVGPWAESKIGSGYARKLAVFMLSGALLGGVLAVAPVAAPAASASIPNCADSDYQCGYLHGFADGRVAKVNGLCAKQHYYKKKGREVPSELGYRRAFEHLCPA